jgi:hypothetical protein
MIGSCQREARRRCGAVMTVVGLFGHDIISRDPALDSIVLQGAAMATRS